MGQVARTKSIGQQRPALIFANPRIFRGDITDLSFAIWRMRTMAEHGSNCWGLRGHITDLRVRVDIGNPWGIGVGGITGSGYFLFPAPIPTTTCPPLAAAVSVLV